MEQEIVRIDLDGVNCYLVKAGDNFILIDTGGHIIMDKQFNNRRESLERELQRAGCEPGKLNLIVLTHGDIDHAANASYIRDKYKARIAIHSDDVELVENPCIDKLMESFNYRTLLYRIVFMFMKKLIKKVSFKILDDFDKFSPDILIDEGYDLSKHGLQAIVLHIPGHTAGSIGIYTAEGDLFAGDIYTNINKPDMAPNAYDFKAMEASIGRLGSMDIRTVYPGHGKPFDAKCLKR